MTVPVSSSPSIEFNPIQDQNYDPLETEVMKIFGLESLPPLFHLHRPCYAHFVAYLQAKGPYQPNPKFLELVLQLIQKCEYPYSHNQLQSIETNLFYQSGGLSTFSSSVVRRVQR